VSVHRIKAGTAGQLLEHYPPSRVASATWELQDLTYGDTTASRVLASGAATADSFSQATSALAGPSAANARRVPIANTTDLVIGRRYEIVGGDSSEVFELAGINTNSYALAKWPLVGTYATGATVSGLRLVAGTTIPSSVYDDEHLLDLQRQLRVVWVMSTGSIVWRQALLVRNDEGDLDVQNVAAKVRSKWPDVHTRLDQHNRDVLPDLVAAAKSELRTMLLKNGITLERYLVGDTGEWACAWRVLLDLAHTGNIPANTTAERWQDHCENRFLEFWQPLVQETQPAETTKTDPATDDALPRQGHASLVLA
jgi:hypothetical protein